ncbi:MAG: hypothetical protein H6Q05_3838 [Acidobacteria bacterium]|nr:hypothetical protein [Acidobacteriota bacterium]
MTLEKIYEAQQVAPALTAALRRNAEHGIPVAQHRPANGFRGRTPIARGELPCRPPALLIKDQTRSLHIICISYIHKTLNRDSVQECKDALFGARQATDWILIGQRRADTPSDSEM